MKDSMTLPPLGGVEPRRPNGEPPEFAIDPETTISAASSNLPLTSVDRSKTNTTRFQRRRWPWKILLLILIGVVVVGWVTRDRWMDRSPVETIAAPLTEKVVSLGRLEPKGEVIEVSGPSGSGDARVQSLAVDVGDRVNEGDVLAVLDNNEQLQAQLNVAHAQFEQSIKRLEQAKMVASTTRDQLEASLESFKSQYEVAKQNLARQEQLRSSRVTSQQEYEDVLLSVDTASKAVAEAKARLARYAKNIGESIDVQVAQSDVRVAEASQQQAEALLDRSYVRAPESGTILDIDLRPGERIGQQTLLRMGQTDTMMVRAEVYESDVAKIYVGQSANIYASAFEQPLSGVVQQVGNLVQQQTIVDSNPAANTDARVVEILVRLANRESPAAAKFVGMQVRVEFAL